MNKNKAINLAMDALRHLIKEKREYIAHYFPDSTGQAKVELDNFEKAIKVLKGLKDNDTSKA
jgi:hypothetical protein